MTATEQNLITKQTNGGIAMQKMLSGSSGSAAKYANPGRRISLWRSLMFDLTWALEDLHEKLVKPKRASRLNSGLNQKAMLKESADPKPPLIGK
jgi:hypothetical protein